MSRTWKVMLASVTAGMMLGLSAAPAVAAPFSEAASGVFDPSNPNEFRMHGTVTGTPINGTYEGLLTFSQQHDPSTNCSPGTTLNVTLSDAAGSISKTETGTFCDTSGETFPQGTAIITGTYTITGGTGAYEGATGSGSVTTRLAGPIGGYWQTWTSEEEGTFELPAVVEPPASLELTPATAENTVGEEHCVTATVRDDAGNPVAGVPVRFTVEGANSSQGESSTDADGQARHCYTGTAAGDDTIRSFADGNDNDQRDEGEPADSAAKHYVAAPAAHLSLTPASAVNTVGEEHCLTASASDEHGNPTEGVAIIFDVAGANERSGSNETGGGGQAEFCYTGELPGDDALTAFADTDGDGSPDEGEPEAHATKRYVVPSSSEGCRVTTAGRITASNGHIATFGGNVRVAATAEGELTYRDHGPASPLAVKSVEILSVTCTADRTSIFGTAELNGEPVSFRIDVQDHGEPGSQDTYRIRVGGYDSGEQRLEGGNVQIQP